MKGGGHTFLSLVGEALQCCVSAATSAKATYGEILYAQKLPKELPTDKGGWCWTCGKFICGKDAEFQACIIPYFDAVMHHEFSKFTQLMFSMFFAPLFPLLCYSIQSQLWHSFRSLMERGLLSKGFQYASIFGLHVLQLRTFSREIKKDYLTHICIEL